MAHSSTTKEVIQNNSSLDFYEKLEFKFRKSTGYESDFVDVTEYLLQKGSISVSQRLDFDSYGYGQFKTGSAKFTLDNTNGKFNNENDVYSLFSGSFARHYTKVKYSAGYKDEDGNRIDEVTFQGLINGKKISQDFEEGTIKFEVLGYEQVLTERIIQTGTITSSLASDVIGDIFDGDSYLTDFIGYSAGNINPGNDITFDAATEFEEKKVANILNDIAKKTSSVWYIDSSLNIIFKSRTMGVADPFKFIGGPSGTRETNILDISSIDDGFTKIINTVRYSSNGEETVTQSSVQGRIDKFGVNELSLDGDDITTSSTITTISNNIINDNETPKTRVILTTVYMPNVIGFLDKCTISYTPKIKPQNEKLLVFNDGNSQFNSDYYFGRYETRLILKDNIFYKYMGFSHNTKKGITKHYLVEN